MRDGRILEHAVAHCLGSVAHPMSDAQLDAKFRLQAQAVVAPARAEALLALCRHVDEAGDVGARLRPLLAS